MPLSGKSNAELKRLLTSYGIKHGPVLSSTRSLYEKKLEEAMANDRTFYREVEEITDIIYHRPTKRKISANLNTPTASSWNPSSRIDKGSNAELQRDQQPEQETHRESSTETPKDQQPDQVAEIPSADIDVRSSVVLHKEEQHDTVYLVTRLNKVPAKRPTRGGSEGKGWMAIPAVLLLTALTAAGYYTLSTDSLLFY